MDLSKRLVLVKSSVREEDYPAFTPDDVIFFVWGYYMPEGLILNHSDPYIDLYIMCFLGVYL